MVQDRIPLEAEEFLKPRSLKKVRGFKTEKHHSIEASSHDQINTTRFWLEHDQKIFMTNFFYKTKFYLIFLKILHRQTFSVSLTKIIIFWSCSNVNVCC